MKCDIVVDRIMNSPAKITENKKSVKEYLNCTRTKSTNFRYNNLRKVLRLEHHSKHLSIAEDWRSGRIALSTQQTGALHKQLKIQNGIKEL